MPPSGLENLHKLEVLSLYGNEISTLENLDHLGGLHAAACREFQLKTATTLRLEFRLILKVENLRALLSLRRLFLDNNLIERISGLDSLVHLEWLDLSFNRIRKIEGE